MLEFCNPYSDGLPSSLSDDTGAAKINRTGSLRVAMLGSWPPLRGLSSYCFECALSLADVADVEFISFRKLYPRFLYPGGDLTEDPTFPECRHDRLTVRRRLTWYNPFTWLGEGIHSQADLLHAQWWSLPLAPIYFTICQIFKFRKKPIVFTVHNVQSHEQSKLFSKASQLLFQIGDHFIVHTRQSRERLTALYGTAPDRISLIPHGSLDFQIGCSTDRDGIRREIGFADHHKVILMFGAIRAYKGVETALRAFSRVIEKIPDCRLLVAGKLWEPWEPYQLLIKELGLTKHVVLHLDYVPSGDVHRFFCTADLVILPYHHFDSQSGVGSTAISFRKPMIVTDVGGLPELVDDRRFIVPPVNQEKLAEAMIACLRDPALLAEMAKASEVVAERLSWTTIASKTCEVYRHVIGRTKQHGEVMN